MEALLLIEVDGMAEEVVEREAHAVAKVVKENGGELKLAGSDAERDQLWAARRAALPALAQLNPTVVLEDATVPRTRVTDMLVACQKIAEKYGLKMGTFGHAGDGNLHPTILTDANNKEEMERVHKAVDEIFATALSFGGTLSGEHGIGIAKMRYLGDEIGESGAQDDAEHKGGSGPAVSIESRQDDPCKGGITMTIAGVEKGGGMETLYDALEPVREELSEMHEVRQLHGCLPRLSHRQSRGRRGAWEDSRCGSSPRGA